jgi:hypothetical protein
VPLFNTDGSSLTDVAGYRVHYGTSSTNLAHSISIANSAMTSISITGLEPRTYYFTVTTLNSMGVESGPSGVLSWAP